MADRKSDHLYTSPKSGDSRKPSPKRKDTGTPPPGDGKSTAHRSGKVGAHVVKKEADTGEHATRGRASPATGRHNSPSPVRGRPSEQISSPVHFQSGRNHSPNSRLEEGRSPVGVRHEQEYHSVRQASPYQHEISPHHLQQQQHLHMAAVSSLQQMERKYSPIPFSGYMEPKVILNRLEVAIPQEGRSPLGLERKVSHGDMRRFSPNPTYRHEQKLSPSTGASAPVELRVSPVSHVMESRLSPGPPHDQRPSSLSPLSITDRRPSPAHMPERTSPMPTLGAHITPPPAHVPQQKPHKASPTVYVGPSGSPVEQSKLSPNSPTSTDAHLPQGAQGPQSSLSPGSHLHGDRSHLSPKPGFGGLGHIERKLSPSRDGRPSPSPLKAYLLQAVPASERRSPNRHMDTAERKLSPSAERHFSPSPIRVGLSPNEPFRHDLGVGGPLPRFSPNPHHSPSHSRTPGDQPLETLRIHVPHHAHGPVVRISPSGPGDVIAHHTPALPVGAVIGEDLKGHSPKSLHRPTPAMPRALASPPKGAPVPGKPLLSAHLGGAPFVPQGMYPSGPQPTPAFISQGLIMHAHAPPRVSAPLPSHQRPAPNPFSFPGTPQMDTPGKLPAPSQLSSITRPVAQTVAVAKPQSHSMRKAVSDITAIKSPRRTEDSDSEGMPRLTPEGPWPGILEEKRRPSFHLGLHQNQDNAETEYSALANPFSMRVQILNNFPTNSTLYRSAYRSQSVAMHRARCSCITSAAKSLDILRQNLQKAMNKEIDEIIQKYMEKFFKPGIENIKLNNGQNSVSEEHVHAVSRQILEEAKKMYISERPRSTTPVRDFPDNVSETGSSSGRIRIPSRRRRPSDSDSERSLPVKRKRKGRPPLNMSGRGTPSKTLKSHSPVRREGPKWETDRIKVDTLFVMGARANKALGLGATRGRLYIKHPDIFKYSGDQDDKQWLFDNHHMPATGGKAYMLMVEDIQELAKSDEYRDSPNLLLDEIIGFTVPEWMCEKMKIQMAAMRTDMPKPKVTSRSRSGTPDTRTPQGAGQVSRETHAKLPFSAFSSAASKQVLVEVKTEPSPSNTEEMELLSTGDNEEQNHVEMSPLNMGGGFDDVNSDLDTLDEAPFLAQ